MLALEAQSCDPPAFPLQILMKKKKKKELTTEVRQHRSLIKKLATSMLENSVLQFPCYKNIS